MTCLGDLSTSVAQATRALAAEGHGEDAPAWGWFVPGRIEVLGKHTDYAGGRSLLAATRQGFLAVAVPAAGRRLRLFDATRGVQAVVPLDANAASSSGWARYPLAVARRLARDFPAVDPRADLGLDLSFTNDLPTAAGMSSSSAFVVTSFLALATRRDLFSDPRFREHLSRPEALAGYLGAVENGYPFGPFAGDHGVGTFGGSEDHTAILCCRPAELLQASYAPVVFERRIPILSGQVFAIASSGVEAAKADGARERYNRASRLASEAAEIWRQTTGSAERHLAEIAARAGARTLDALPDAFRSRLGASNGVHATRVDHFLVESEELVPAAGDALERGDLAAFGEIVDRSQELGARLLGNQIPETIFLARSARQLGASSASAFGAGFGGSVWAMVAEVEIERFLGSWREAYHSAFPAHAGRSRFLWTPAAEGARPLHRSGSEEIL